MTVVNIHTRKDSIVKNACAQCTIPVRIIILIYKKTLTSMTKTYNNHPYCYIKHPHKTSYC